MPTVRDCLQQHAAAYLANYEDRMPAEHRRVLDALIKCRTGTLGYCVYECANCQSRHWVGRSCGNRHCPSCQHEKTHAWLARQTQRLLPVPYFLVTFTVPEALRPLLRAHQRVGYAALFEAGSQTIRELARNPRFVGSDRLGFTGVLHTWGRDLGYHPHVHFIVPGGGVSDDGLSWKPSAANFLFPGKCAAPIYRAKFRDALKAAGLYHQVPAEAWRQKWVVDVQPVGDGRAALKYLAPYVFRVAISDSRIVACDDQTVTFNVKPSGKKRYRPMTVSGEEFVRRFLQHVLPPRFQKVRHYGWASPNSRTPFELVRMLVWFHVLGCYILTPPAAPSTPPAPRCPDCGGALQLVDVVLPGRLLYYLPDHVLPYLDSG